MKKIHFYKTIILFVIVFVNDSCKKDSPATSSGTVTINPPLPTVNTSPKANAGPDKYVFLPTDTCILAGSASDKENNIQMALWSKISGPSSFFIENPNSLSTTVKNLVQGVYQFELTVTDRMGLYGKDTITVTVNIFSAGTHEVIFNNLTWIPIWYETLEINNFYSFIPTGTPFRVYIQRDSNPAWIEATPLANNGSGGAYEYFVETRPGGAGMYTYGSLYVFGYGTDFSDTPSVKVLF